jgi:hypothetical protein
MSITTGTANVQIIKDTADKLVAKFLYFTSNGTDESDALKVNVETLAARTFILEVQNANVVFVPGETILGATSNATARVTEWDKATKKITVVGLTGNTAFADGETISTRVYNTGNTALKASGAQTTPPRVLDIAGIWYSIDPDMTVEIGFGGVYANTTPFVAPVILLSGAGYYGKNALPGLLTNAMLNATGHVYTSTYTTTSAKAAYSVVVEFHKTKGFAQIPTY